MIRKLLPKDTEKVLNIWLEASLQAHDFVAENYWRQMLPIVRDYYLPCAEIWVLEDRRQIKGFLALLDDRHIGALFVRPEYQKQKNGSKLLEFVKKRHSRLTLHVFTKNERAVRFYQKHDFKIVSEQKNPDVGENELLMGWALGCKSGHYKRFRGDS